MVLHGYIYIYIIYGYNIYNGYNNGYKWLILYGKYKWLYIYIWLENVIIITGYKWLYMVISMGLYMNHKWGDLLVLIFCKGP